MLYAIKYAYVLAFLLVEGIESHLVLKCDLLSHQRS